MRNRLESLEPTMSKMSPCPWPDTPSAPALRRRENGALSDTPEDTGVEPPSPIGIASICLQVKAGGDAAVLTGIMKALLALDTWAGKEGGLLDRDFIATRVEGFDALVEDVYATSWAEITEASGLRRTELEAVAQAYAK